MLHAETKWRITRRLSGTIQSLGTGSLCCILVGKENCCSKSFCEHGEGDWFTLHKKQNHFRMIDGIAIDRDSA